jgi:predicted AAA+ superfamily ATPase
LQIKKISIPHIPSITLLRDLLNYTPSQWHQLSEVSRSLIGHFHEYLVRGGFPQTALVESIPQAQRLLREDIIDKVLKRDMTALFGVRRILELEQTFIYLCMHDGGIQDLAALSSNLAIPKPTVQNFISLLEAAHLLYRLPPFGYGKEVLRARYKLYFADPAIAPAILMKGKALLEDPKALGQTVETAVFVHLKGSRATIHGAIDHARLSYWRDPKNRELDLVVQMGQQTIPIEVKYHSHQTRVEEVQGLVHFCLQKGEAKQGYVVTKEAEDIGLLEFPDSPAPLIRLPAALFCYWLGESEMGGKTLFIELG